MTNPTKPPSRLSTESKKLWRSVLADDELESRHEAILGTALEALDRTRHAQAQLQQDGLTTLDRYGGVKAHAVPQRSEQRKLIPAISETPHSALTLSRSPRGRKSSRDGTVRHLP